MIARFALTLGLPALVVALLAIPVAAGEGITISKVSPDQGTIGTQIMVTVDGPLGTKKPKVELTPADPPPGAKVKAIKPKVLDIADQGGDTFLLTLELKKAKAPGLFDLTVIPKDKNVAPGTLEDAFSINAPSVASVSPDQGAPKDLVTITGADFGTKKPKVIIGEKKKGKVKAILGPGSLLVALPKVAPGTYDVTVINKIGEGTLPDGVTLTDTGGGGGPGGGNSDVSILHGFETTDGSMPISTLLEHTDGSFYGTTWQGGANGCGTVFKITPNGTLTTLHDLVGATDGCGPQQGLTLGPDGKFYGVAATEGPGDLGTVFRVDPDAGGGDGTVFEVVHPFTGPFAPSGPTGRLVLGPDEALYGTSIAGGDDVIGGAVFKVTTAGDMTVLHSFAVGDGMGDLPRWGLAVGDDGNLYGVTEGGGNCGTCGTVYRLTTGGDHTLLHAFSGLDGMGPSGALAEGGDGQLYGVTALGGTFGLGTIYKMSLAGAFTPVHSFDGTGNATVPKGPLFLADDGNMYGTANVVFSLAPNNAVSVLYTLLDLALEFGAEAPGNPQGGMIQGADGDLYGTSPGGGPVNAGTVFKVEL